MLTGKVIEQGNGLPSEDGFAIGRGGPYRIVSMCSRIHTDDPRGNYVHAQVTEANWCDVPDGTELTGSLIDLDGDDQ